MRSKSFLYLSASVFAIISILTLSCQDKNAVSITVSGKPLFEINDNLFGHFFEKCSWDGEIGGDLAFDTVKHAIRIDVQKMIDSLKIPLLRYPGGSDVDYYDWTNLIELTDREKRPAYNSRQGVEVSENEIGLIEFLDFCEQKYIEPLLVVNFGDAYFGKRTSEDAADMAAAMVAFCNGDVNSTNPFISQWAGIRAFNGRSKPYNVRKFQIGNEVMLFDWEVLGYKKTAPDFLSRHYYHLLNIFIKAMRAVDPTIEIIVDGNPLGFVLAAPKYLTEQYDYLAFHHYTPWGIDEILDSTGSKVDTLSPEQVYQALIAINQFDTLTGQAIIDNMVLNELRTQNVPIAITEWNWNGWFNKPIKDRGYRDSDWAKGLGAASFLHGIMRQGDKVAMANQSMLIGQAWGITTIRLSDGEKPVFLPTGYITGLYSRYHGSSFLHINIENNKFFTQPYQLGAIHPNKKIAMVDAVATGNEKTVFVHLINRAYKQPIDIHVDVPSGYNGFAELVTIQSDLKYSVNDGVMPECSNIIETKHKVRYSNGKVRLTLEPQTVNVLIVNK